MESCTLVVETGEVKVTIKFPLRVAGHGCPRDRGPGAAGPIVQGEARNGAVGGRAGIDVGAADARGDRKIHLQRVRPVDVGRLPAAVGSGVTVHRVQRVISAGHGTRDDRALLAQVQAHVGADGVARRAIGPKKRNLPHRDGGIRAVEANLRSRDRRAEHDVEHGRLLPLKLAPGTVVQELLLKDWSEKFATGAVSSLPR